MTARYRTLITAGDAGVHLHDPDWAFVDCRFQLADPGWGRRAYHEEHIPGAVYVDLDRDLSGLVRAGRTGRHPLPAVDALTTTLGRLGIDANTQVVAYDDAGGALAAARLWWLLRWLGHDAVAVLDGGLAAWIAAGLPLAAGKEERSPRRFQARPRPELMATAEDVLAATRSGRAAVLDARAVDRYRGENETIDPVAGHIPGARSLPYSGNLDPDRRFRPSEELAARFEQAHRGEDAPIMYCGSGVTAAHNVLAYAHAGLGEARLYPGSWSEWITDPERPVRTGDEP